MAHQDHIVDRLSMRIGSLLPDHIKEEATIFEGVLESYFEYLESEIITLDTVQELDGVQFEEGIKSLRMPFFLKKVQMQLHQILQMQNYYKKIQQTHS